MDSNKKTPWYKLSGHGFEGWSWQVFLAMTVFILILQMSLR